MTEGKEYELQEDGTHTLYNVKFDEDENEIERKEKSKGHKLVWNEAAPFVLNYI